MAFAAKAGSVSLPAEGLVRKQKQNKQQSPNTIILKRFILFLSETGLRTSEGCIQKQRFLCNTKFSERYLAFSFCSKLIRYF